MSKWTRTSINSIMTQNLISDNLTEVDAAEVQQNLGATKAKQIFFPKPADR